MSDETDQEVAALLIAAKPKAAPVYRWRCCRCANPQESKERPPSPQFCARCRPIALEHATEPATRPVYGDESEDDGEPIERVWIVPDFNDPAPREHIQSDTPPSAATVTATKETEMTATAPPPVKAAEKKPDHVPDAGKKVATPAMICPNPKCGAPVVQNGRGRRAIYCSGRCKDVVQKARAREREKAAAPPVVGPFACPNCPETFESERKRNGHLAWCGKKRAANQAAPARGAETKKDRVVTEARALGDALAKGLAGAVKARDAFPPARGPIVRMHKADIEVECATVEDAAAFVRAMQAGK